MHAQPGARVWYQMSSPVTCSTDGRQTSRCPGSPAPLPPCLRQQQGQARGTCYQSQAGDRPAWRVSVSGSTRVHHTTPLPPWSHPMAPSLPRTVDVCGGAVAVVQRGSRNQEVLLLLSQARAVEHGSKRPTEGRRALDRFGQTARISAAAAAVCPADAWQARAWAAELSMTSNRAVSAHCSVHVHSRSAEQPLCSMADRFAGCFAVHNGRMTEPLPWLAWA